MTWLQNLKTNCKEPVPIYVNDLDVPVYIRRDRRARRLTLRINEAGREVILTLPTHCKNSEAEAFLKRNQSWLLDRLAEIPTAVPFRDGALVPLRGELHKIHFNGRLRQNPIVWCEPAEHQNHGHLHVCGLPEHAPRRLTDWLKKQARLDLDQRVQWHAARLGLKPKRLSVRDQKSRWGSCSSSGVLSFSWRLILAPPSVLDYVAAHEVAHLAEMNHGPKFWKLVRQTMPDMDEACAWLKTKGVELHRYG